MLDIRRNSITVPVPPDLTINREFETTLLNREPAVSDFTLPIDLPLTDQLKQMLDMPHNLATPIVNREYEVELIIDGIYVNKVTLKVLRTKLKQQVCQVSIIGNYGSFAKVVGDKKVNELSLGGTRSLGSVPPPATINFFNDQGYGFTGNLYYEGTGAGDYIRDINKGTIASDFLFPTTVDEKINLDYGHVTLKDDETVRSIINGYDYLNDAMVDPILHYLNSVYSNTTFSSERHYWVPMFRLSYILRQCFEELGFTVAGTTLAAFDNVLLYNTYSINKVAFDYNHLSVAGVLKISNAVSAVVPQNHVPRWKIIDFISEVSKNYNLQYNISYTDKTVEIKKLGDFSTAAKKDLSLIAFPEPEINYEKAEFQNGYKFSYEWDAEDGASGEDIKEDVTTYNFKGSVSDVSLLSTLAAPVAFDIAFVKNLNCFYQFGGQDWFFYSQNLDKYKTSDKDQLQEITTRVVPTGLKYINYSLQNTGLTKIDVTDTIIGPYSAMGIEGDGMFAIDLSKLQGTGTIMLYTPGTLFRQETSRLEVVTQPHLCLWQGMQERYNSSSVFHKYPMASNSPYDANGISITFESLSWVDPIGWGIYHQYWEQFVMLLAQALQVDYKIDLDAVTYSSLDMNSDIIVIDRLQYICRKANIIMPFPNIATLTLVRI